jgi:hypothetical protein
MRVRGFSTVMLTPDAFRKVPDGHCDQLQFFEFWEEANGRGCDFNAGFGQASPLSVPNV